MDIFENFQSDNLKDEQIRVTLERPKRTSVHDVIRVITGNLQYKRTWKDLHEKYLEVGVHTTYFKFPGRGQRDTPVVGARGLVTIMNLLAGERAARFRAGRGRCTGEISWR